jgi:hypothetical protein
MTRKEKSCYMYFAKLRAGVDIIRKQMLQFVIMVVLPLLAGGAHYGEKARAAQQNQNTTDERWGIYETMLDDHVVVILFHEGLEKQVSQSNLENSMMVQITWKKAQKNGFPSSEELDIVNALDSQIEQAIQSANGIYLGRATGNGGRIIMALVQTDTAALTKKIKQLAVQMSYAAKVAPIPDPGKELYWNFTLPSEEERQIMSDNLVLEQLRRSKDVAEQVRPVDHWIYFDKKKQLMNMLCGSKARNIRRLKYPNHPRKNLKNQHGL